MRRALLALLAAIMLALFPSTALAYEGDDEVMGVSDSNPGVGEEFTVTVQSGECPTVTLDADSSASATTIDGEQTNSATKPAAGEVTYTVAISAEGEYQLAATCDATDEVLGVQMVVVGDAGASAGGDTDDAAGGGVLPATGADATTTLIAGGGVLLLVAGAVLALRRRKPASA